ncbi:PTS lactose/cellobiose transporter subunit IIA [Serratia fonticola]|uniref:PTS lactose/cellobiose transporter subunit IIA n=1 Tax=Serratia fonticola TaxID=47917 RepID=UPI002097C2D5|nr:PTS lactose/cellobiose transporter subunit IIA [Serratia fonticola]MCO7510424.1 PTS lactose/cellobiose transporter subunit IIA [Serratia fonticola]
MDLENEVMELIANAGYARSLVFQAMRFAREEEDFVQAEQYMQQAQEALSGAHHVQTKLIEMDEGSGKIPVHLVMVHAQDHLMNAIMLMEMGREIIALHQKIAR